MMNLNQRDVASRVDSFVKNEVLCLMPAELMDAPSVASKLEEEFLECLTENEDFMEILEYWIVSKYLGEKLRAKGECVARLSTCYVWGRQTSGQAIMMDDVIQRIACE